MVDQSKAGLAEKRCFNAKLEKRLASYTLAASAAGLGLLAMAPTSKTGIVYTPAHSFFRGLGSPSSVELDLAHNGVSEFRVEWLRTEHRTWLQVHPLTSGAQAIGSQSSILFAHALPFGAKIGSSGRFYRKNEVMVSYLSLATYGQWRHAHNLYLGLKFVLNGQTNYGWAEFSVGQQFRGAELQGYAYNTIANKAIFAGEKGELASASAGVPKASTLGLLARGSLGLEFWRQPHLR